MCFTSDATQVIDVPESAPLTGYRVFKLDQDGYLYSVAVGRAPWLAEPHKAQCKCTLDRPHSVPTLDGGCGLHAYSTPLGANTSNYEGVLGRVELWGTVAKHDDQGYRAKYMRVTAIARRVWNCGAEACDTCAESQSRLDKHISAIAERHGATIVDSVHDLADAAVVR